MKKIIFLIVFTIGGWQHALAQVATNGGSGLAATYTSLSGAITALNAATITSPVVITLTGNETSPAGGYNITATGTSTNTITIAGSSSTITAPSQTAGSLTDAIFKIVGGDYITIQGFTMQERSLTPVAADVTAGTNTMTEFGVALFYATTTNGAQNCTIQNNTITLSRTYQNTFGIYSNSTHSATNITAAATASSPAGSNSGLKVYGNTISNINHGILIVGPTAAANFNTGIDIGGTASGTGNTISNFGTTGTFSGFLNVSGTVNGIVVRNSTGFNVSYNSITSSNGGITAATTLSGIFIPAASIAPSGTFTNTINNNTIALTHGFTSGTIQGIRVDNTTGTGTSTQNINNNNFTALRSSVVTSGTITAISNSMPNLANNCNGNTFTNISTNTTGSFTFFAHIYNMPATGSQTLDGNSIVTGFSKTGAGGTVTISTSGSSSPNGTFHTFTNNNFSNITVTGATGITGVSNGDGSSSSATRTVTGNTFNNWTGGTSAIMGLSYAYIGGTTSSVSNNTLTNITGQGSLTGINIGSLASLATTLNVANNTISNLTGGSVTGLACTNASTTVNINGNTINTLSATAVASTTTALSIGGGATTNVFQNKIYNISGTHASSTVRGILISAGLNINIYNNLIGDLTAPAASGTDVIRGIIITSTTALSTHKIYSNTIYLNAASSGTNFGGSGIYHTVNATSTTSALDLQNNIIINGLTPKGTGLAVAFRRSAGTANNLANYAATSDKNLFYAGTPGASNLIYSDGTSSAQTIADYKAGVFTAGTIAPRDANSFTEAWTSSNFESVTGSSAKYLQPATTFITQVESGGNTIALTSPDYNNVVRPGLGGTSYDIGAWEFSGQGQTQGLTVTYDSQNGSAIANGSTTTGGSIAASPGTPTRAGYTFNGWFVASTGGSAINFPYTHGRTASFTLYAQWTANTLTVTYDSQSGTAIANGSTTTGGSIATSPGTPTRTGYTFNGWFVASTGGSAISFPYTHGRTASFTLYAQWTANNLTVTYDSQSGTAIANGSTTTGGSIATSPGTPARTGYTFNGWFVAATGGSAISFPYTHGRTASFTLYAQWTANNLTVTYDSQSGTAIANGSTTTGGSIAASPGTPTRAGFTFNGWFAASSGGSAISFPYTHGQTANFTLYAQWTATYMITVTAGAGGTISPGTGIVNAGSNNTYTITPDAGYLISDVTVDGTSATALITGSYALGGTYDFIDVQGDHTISVTFDLVCSSTWTGAISTVWNTAGNWSCGVVPDVASDVTIAATTNQPIISSDVAIKTVTLNTGTSLTVSTGFNLTVTNYIDNSGTLTVENNANLIQTAVANTNSGSGTAIVKRDSNVLKRLDYTMWSSPVTGTQTLLQFSPLTSTTSAVRFYTYNPTTNLYNTATVGNSFATATGYLIRMPNEKPGSLGLTTDYYKGLEAITYNGVFTGALNNGTISVNSLISDKYYSVGNPYPSTLSADVFLSVNSTAGTLYFWRKTNAAPGTAYSTYTAGLGGVAGASGITPNGTIQVGQGFIVKTAGTSLSFTNAMRETAPNSTQFLKTKKVADKSRLWLDLSDATGRINQVLIGYLDGATVGFDAGIDGKYFNDSKIALTSIVEGEEYVIQGRPTFDATDVVALGFKTDVAGDYSIALNSFDGVFASGQEVYLVDAVAGKEIDIKTGSYSFTATAGVDNARFSLKYQKTLKVDAQAFNENTVSIFKNNGAIVVNSTLKNIKTIEVYDVRGRLIAQQKNVNATTATISHLKVVRQVLIVKVTGEDNKVVSKKIVN